MKILLAVDGSEYTSRMIDYLASHKEWSSAGHAFTVFTAVLPVPHRAAAFAGPDLVRQYCEEEARAVLDPVRAALAERGIAATAAHDIGHPSTVIAQFAEDGKFDLVIMGSRGHGALANFVLGSVAMQVLARCSVPVLLVR